MSILPPLSLLPSSSGPRTSAAALLLAIAWTAPAAAHDLNPLEPGSSERSSVELPAGMSPAALEAASQRLLFDEAGDGRVWARGRNWKASAGSQGFTYIPFLGSDAPQNYPVQFALSSVTSGGETIAFDAAPKPALDGTQITLDRGSVSEVYHATYETIEQTFVFRTLPGRGELRVAMDVETELLGRPDGAGYSFSNGRGSVNYGAATAIDARGKSAALEQVWTEGGVELIVPAGFLSDAILPLTIDPVIFTRQVIEDGANQINVDVAFDGQNSVYQIVYEIEFSFSDKDVYSVFYSAGSDVVGSVVSVDISSATWSDPHVASCYQRETFLCVATVGNALGSREIWGRTRNAQDGSRGSQFVINDDFGDNSHADVGGYGNDAFTSFSFCVVWQRSNVGITDSGIFSQGVTHFGTQVGGVTQVADISGQVDIAPRISKSSGPITLPSTAHQYMVVWERVESPTNHDIWARVVDFDNDTAGHPRYRAYSFSDARNPDVSMQNTETDLSSDPHYVVVFERLVGTDYDIFAIVAEDGDANNARSVTAMQDIDLRDEQSQPRVAFEGLDYLITYRGEAPGGGWYLYSTALNVVTDGSELRSGLVERVNAIRLGDGSVVATAIASNFVSTVIPTEALAVWTATGGSGSDGDVAAAILNEDTGLAVGSQYCAAADNQTGESGWLRALGMSRFASSASFRLDASSLPPNQFCLFLVGSGNDVTPNPGGSAGDLCVSGTFGRFNSQIAASDASGNLSILVSTGALPSPSGVIAFAPGDTWNFQCWSRDVQNGVAASNFTNAVAVTLL